MKNVFTSPKTYMFAALAVIVVTASAWQFRDKKPHSDSAGVYHYQNGDSDTTKPRKHGYDKNDNGVKWFDNDEPGDIDINLDGLDSTINQTVREALSNIDVKEIVNQAMQQVKEIDWNAINKEINQSLKDAQKEINNIDMKEINREIKRAMDEVNSREIKETIDSARINEIIRDALRNVRVELGHRRA